MRAKKIFEEEFRWIKNNKSKEDIEKSFEGKSPQEKFRGALEYNFPWILEESIKEGASPNYSQNYPIRYAASNGFIEILKILLKSKRCNPADSKNLAIMWAATDGQLESLKLLINDKRTDPSDDKNCALRVTLDYIEDSPQMKQCVLILLKDKRVIEFLKNQIFTRHIIKSKLNIDI